MYNPANDRQLAKLRRAVEAAHKHLAQLREQRKESIKTFVGANYQGGKEKPTPLNVLELAVNVYRRHLVNTTPRAIVRARKDEYKPFASLLELALNHLLNQINLGRTLTLAATEALFSLGIIKVGLGKYTEVEIEGVMHDIGQPYADLIDPDDWFHDPHARRYEAVQFAGHYYYLPREYLLQSNLYRNKDILRQAPPSDESDERVARMTRPSRLRVDTLSDYVRLADVWLPMAAKGGLLITYTPEIDGPPLRIEEWQGPEEGPFYLLSYGDVPSNIIPLPPASLWRDIANLANNLFRKLGEQAVRQKKFLAVSARSVQDGEKVRTAADGQTIVLDDLAAAQEMSIGGPDKNNLAFLLWTLNRFSWLAGNLDALGGLAPQAPTLGQDVLLARASSRRIAELQERTADFTRRVVRALAWYLWTDPLIELPLTKRVEGIEIPVKFSAEEKEGEFMDYAIEILPYSLHEPTPGERAALLNQILSSTVIPLAPLLQQQGYTFDFGRLVEILADYYHLPELKAVVKEAVPIENARPIKPFTPPRPQTNRRYTHEYVSNKEPGEEVLAGILSGVEGKE